jgi:TPR repeat protein
MLRAGAPVPSASPPPAVAPAPKPSISDAARERALRLMEKGDQQLSGGNISAARLFYERAADEGLAQGAMALAGTYDASELAQLKVRGVPPDPAQARHWYERARQLGATDADLRLQRLGAN